MATANERRALWFLALVALSGSVVRLVRARGADRAPDPQLARQLSRVDSARERRNRTEPLPPRPRSPARNAPPPLVDLDVADSASIETLPGIGPALAGRIVNHRDSVGRFGSIAALCDVRGVGPSLARALKSRVTFSGQAADDSKCKAPVSGSSKSHVTKPRNRR